MACRADLLRIRYTLGSTRIALVFEETETERTQEFVLRWSPDSGRSFREIVRQQWNFNLPNAMRESEDYQVGLSDVTALELGHRARHQSGIDSRLAQESADVLTRTDSLDCHSE